jgi:hypothetical protein
MSEKNKEKKNKKKLVSFSLNLIAIIIEFELI